MMSFLAVSLALAPQAYGVGQDVDVQSAQSASLRLRGTQVQQEVWESVKDALVFLPDGIGTPFGLAALIDSEGYFLAHSSAVVAEPLTAHFSDGTPVRLARVGYDSTTQLVLFKAHNWQHLTRSAISVADPDHPGRDMTMVTAEGLLRSTITRQNVPGVAQQNNRYLPVNEVQFESQAAPIGGALVFNRSGELMGILGATLTKAPGAENTAELALKAYGPQGLTVGYALSPKVLRRVVNGFLTDSHEVQHPNVGILFRDSQLPKGAVITQVKPDSPAAENGLAVGDLITAVDETPLTGALDLAIRLFDKDPGETIVFHYTRNGRPLKVEMTVGIGDALKVLLHLFQAEEAASERPVVTRIIRL